MFDMKKSRGILSLILVAAVIVLLGVTSIFGLNSKGMGSARNIHLGLDLEGGVSITYQAKDDNPSQEDMDDTVYKLRRSTVQRHRLTSREITGSASRYRESRTRTRSWRSWDSRETCISSVRMTAREMQTTL